MAYENSLSEVFWITPLKLQGNTLFGPVDD
jgi:hypothetical protein